MSDRGKYRVLRPHYRRVMRDDVEYADVQRFVLVGYVDSLAEAKDRFEPVLLGYSPVLELASGAPDRLLDLDRAISNQPL